MRWFRDHIGNGAWLALLALAINVGLSFGHVHAFDAKVPLQGSLAALTASDGNQKPNHPADTQADFLCPICMAASAMANAVAAAPPVLPTVFAYARVNQVVEPEFAGVQPP